MKRFVPVLALLLAGCASAPAGSVSAEPIAVKPWAPRNISSERFESHAAFDPLTGDLWFVRSDPDFTHWRIFVSACGPAGWSEAKPAPIAGDGYEADPWFTPDGRSLYFISSRTSDGVKRNDMDLWRVTRDASGKWGEPIRLPAPVNSEAHEWFPRLGADGWLYFGSGRPGGLGKTDIWRAKETAGSWQVENAGPSINSAVGDFEALPAPDGKFIIVQTDDGYMRSERTKEGWSPRVKMAPEINVNGSEIGATLSPSGRTMLFARDTKGPKSGEFFVAHLGPREAWPPACPVKKR